MCEWWEDIVNDEAYKRIEIKSFSSIFELQTFVVSVDATNYKCMSRLVSLVDGNVTHVIVYTLL